MWSQTRAWFGRRFDYGVLTVAFFDYSLGFMHEGVARIEVVLCSKALPEAMRVCHGVEGDSAN